MGGRFCDDGGDYAGGDSCENEVAIHFAPFVAAGWGVEMVLAIVDVIAAFPVFVADVGAFLPLFMTDVVMIVVVIFGEGERA